MIRDVELHLAGALMTTLGGVAGSHCKTTTVRPWGRG